MSDQEIATHEACGQCPYRDWCRACVGGAGRLDAHKRPREEQNSICCGQHGLGMGSSPVGMTVSTLREQLRFRW